MYDQKVQHANVHYPLPVIQTLFASVVCYVIYQAFWMKDRFRRLYESHKVPIEQNAIDFFFHQISQLITGLKILFAWCQHFLNNQSAVARLTM